MGWGGATGGAHLHAAVVERAADKVAAGVRQVELHLQALHLPPVALALDRGLRRDQVAVPACQAPQTCCGVVTATG
jgi:hypothetical protein